MKRLVLGPVGWPCTLAECPPGLFLYNDTVGFKTDYNAMEPVPPVNVPGDQLRWKVGTHPDAYNSAGENFCVGTKDETDRQFVQPLDWMWEEF